MSPHGGAKRSVVLLGLGNTLLSDDGVGVLVVRAIAGEARALGAQVAEAEVAGFALVDVLGDHDAAVVVDAARLPGLAPGEIVVRGLDEFEPSLHLVAAHQVDLPAAIALGRAMGHRMPEVVRVVAVQVADDRTFCESCTPEVAAAVGTAARLALGLVEELVRS